MLITVLLLFLALAIGAAVWGHSGLGYARWSPAGLILAVLLVLWLSGFLHT